MDELQERRLRRKAMRGLEGGASPTQLARTLHRSRQWLNKWWHRLVEHGRAGLKSQSRQPHHTPRRYADSLRCAIVRARRHLQQAAVGLIGATAVLSQLRAWRVRPRPSLSTIARVLRAEGLTRSQTRTAPPPSYYPHPRPTRAFYLQAMDWTAHFLRGGAVIFAFNTVAYETQDVCSRTYADKTAATVCAYALQVWHGFLGLPEALQIDNDGAFSGGRRGPRVFSRFVRLCLYLGIEPIFTPFYEPERNELIESINGLWQTAFWRRRRFRSAAHVHRSNPEFEHWYREIYRPPALEGRTPGQSAQHCHRIRLTAAQIRALPERLPITEGRVHFLRQVDAEGNIMILNEPWRIGRRYVGQYVWAVIWTHRERLEVYYRRSADHPVRRLRTWRYDLPQLAVPLQPEFRRRPRRRKMSTML